MCCFFSHALCGTPSARVSRRSLGLRGRRRRQEPRGGSDEDEDVGTFADAASSSSSSSSTARGLPSTRRSRGTRIFIMFFSSVNDDSHIGGIAAPTRPPRFDDDDDDVAVAVAILFAVLVVVGATRR